MQRTSSAAERQLTSEHQTRDAERPPDGSLQRWAYDYITSDRLSYKLDPGPVPATHADDALPLRVAVPGRPSELRVSQQKVKTPRPGALREAVRRAELLHTFFHHELQAAELMCWAVLAFPETPLSFKRGLLGICGDEIRHMRMYAAHIRQLGSTLGDFPVRDWFWSRVPQVKTPSAFVAVMGLGFEAGNLDHTQRFAERFRAVNDEAGAALQEQVAREEIPHVAFAAHWFRVFEGELSFARWCNALPAPLSPMVMRGDPIDRNARTAAGLDQAFLEALAAWQPVLRGS